MDRWDELRYQSGIMHKLSVFQLIKVRCKQFIHSFNIPLDFGLHFCKFTNQ